MKRFYGILLALLLAVFAISAYASDTPLGAGDALKISVFGNPDLSLETKVSEAGNITFPLIGNVNVNGLSTSDAEKKISGLLIDGGFLRNAEVNILVTELQSQQVSILGQVLRPGRYPISGTRNVTDMLAVAGGVGPEGGDTATVVRTRDGKTTKQVINLVEMIQSSDMKENLTLINGDMVYVDRAPKFYIYGEVQHPGGYRLERNMTVVQALSIGGGLTPRGTERGLRVKRRDTSGSVQMIDVKNDEVLRPDDVVYVKESLF
ncbi:polysaccharide export protein EpsE [Glaciimonas sp. PCH181]|uniref:polysaccharide export protein EpsE n=1 Tax=Glaciimonas sp. PCH181 TaxID=2133943 RepID=UPI000D3A9660|nr:polysaccharide export protein EpsE [Glaciimonas sp. PCH181]PUA18726.1 polysaccharide export protein EpsE [Glaciimonas sp. PCH181]